MMHQRIRIGGAIHRAVYTSSKSCLVRSSSTGCNPDLDRHCREMVKSQDYENYCIGLLVPKDARGAFYAIRAFNIEVATIKDQVRHNSLQAGRIRFQFWRDALRQIYQGKLESRHPVAEALLYYTQKHQLTKRWFERSLEARYANFSSGSNQFETMADLENYAEYGQSSILYLLLQVLNSEDIADVQADKNYIAASHVGVSYGICALLRGMAHHSTMNSTFIPSEIRAKHSLMDNTVLKGPKSPEQLVALKNATYELSSQALAHLEEARKLNQAGSLIKHNICTLYPSQSSQIYLDRLEMHDFDPFTAFSGDHENFYSLKYNWALFQSSWTGRI